MNIRPKIPIYQGGNTLDLDKWIQENQKYYDWYSKLYPNAQILQGNPLKQRQDNADFKQLSSSHHTTDDLRRSAYNNYLYTKDYDARQRDLIYWSDQQKGLDKLTDQQIVDLYNTQAKSIRDAREAPQIYNTKGYSGTNQIFRNMFHNRSVQGTNTPDYNIGYQENQDNIIGTSTWQRRMDRYENPFEKDTQEGQQNRTFYINIPGIDRQVKVYKKENGDLGLFPNSPNNPPSTTPQEDLNKKPGGINPTETKDKESLWSKLGTGLKNVAPDLLDALRLAGNMHNNERVYNESMKAIIPNLQQSYTTHRQIVGDEATKQGFYRRAAQGQTRAARPFTSDADRQVAYMNEAKRIGDELRAQGDLTDNQEIRRTSDESNQHQWANIQRNTEVANNNLTELIKAAAAKHQLTAQKYSADWTNLDQFLLGKQAKLEQNKAKQKAIEDQLNTLSIQEDLLNDTTLAQLKDEADKVWNDPKATQEQKLAAARKYRLANLQKQKQLIQTHYAKSGTKLTYKNNTDKYLYKTSKDIVEHFRKMSKMTDDSRVRTLPKTIKLSSHPRKMQLGGVAPFTVYRPLGAGGESAISTQTSDSTSSKSSKDTAAKDKLDMIKELFKSVQGLPIDASKVYSQITGLLSKYKAFGEEMSTDDIASMYLSAMNQINHLKYSQDAYNKAHAVAVANDSLDEIAVGVNGEMALQNAEGEVTLGTYAKWKESEGKLNPLTNGQLLTMRAHSPNLAFNDRVFDIVNNGIGLTKISAQIKSMAAQLGSSTEKIEGITEVESKQVKAGLQILAGTQGTPDGQYQVTNNTKQQTQQVKAALNYIYTMLPKNYKTILALHSGSEEKSKVLIQNFLVSQTDSVIEQTITPLTGKASNNTNGLGGKGGAESSAGLAFVMGQGPRELIDFNTGTSNAVRVLGIKGVLQTHSKENLGQGATLQDATKSQQGGYLQWNKATFGGSKLNSQAYSHIILNDSTIMGMDLPFTTDINGNEIPDFQMLRKIEQADQEISQNNIQSPNEINKIYQKYGLPAKFDQNGNLNALKYKRFAAIQVTLDEDSLQNKDAILSDEITLAGEIERDLYLQAMKKSDKNYDLSNGMWITGWGKDQIYKGTIFVPYSEDVAFAALSSGEPFKQNLPDNAATVQLMQYAPKASQYVTPDKTLSQIKNN